MNQLERIPRNGRTVREVAEMTGLSKRTIISWTSEPRKKYLARADERRERIRELRSQGKSMRSIAEEVGCSVGLVHRYVHEDRTV